MPVWCSSVADQIAAVKALVFVLMGVCNCLSYLQRINACVTLVLYFPIYSPDHRQTLKFLHCAIN